MSNLRNQKITQAYYFYHYKGDWSDEHGGREVHDWTDRARQDEKAALEFVNEVRKAAGEQTCDHMETLVCSDNT